MPKNPLSERAFMRMLFALPEKRRKDFLAFISLKQFNSRAGLVTLLTLILDRFQPQENKTLEDLGKESGMASSTLEKSLSLLMGLLQDFMLVHAALAKKDHLQTLPFEAWTQQNLPSDLLEREFRRRLRTLQRLPQSDLYLQEELQLEHTRAKLEAAKPRRDQGNLFDRHIQLLDEYYAVARLRYACAATNAARIFGQLSSEKQYTYEGETIPLPLLAQAYRHLLKLLQAESPTPDQIRESLTFLQDHEAKFAIEDRSDLYGYLLNTGFRGMVTGKSIFNDLVYEIYQTLLENQLLLVEGSLSGSHFKNIVTVMARTQRIEEGRVFIHEYAPHLLKADRGLLVPYCLGIVEFHSGHFRETIRQFSALLRQSPNDQFWSLEARSILWKSYFQAYETLSVDEHEEMLRLYHSFRNFVSRNKQIAEHHRIGYQNFIRLFNRLIILSESNNSQQQLDGLRALLKEAQNMEKVTNKEWVISTVKEKIERKKKEIR